MDTLEDLDFANDIVVLVHCHLDIQRSTDDAATIHLGRQVRLNINTDKTKLHMNSVKWPCSP